MARFDFKQFSVDDTGCGMKICSDSVLLGAWFLPAHAEARSVVDAGAGSGVLALMAAQICADAAVTGVEIVPEACGAAAANFAASPWAARLEARPGDFRTVDLPAPVDLIISNPPYFTEGETAPDKARAAARHQQTLTFGELLRRSRSLLAPQGRLGLVAPAEAEASILFEGEMAGLKLRRLCRVLTAPDKQPRRVLMDFAGSDGPMETTTLHLREPDGSPGEDYRRLVDPFYLKIS